MGNIIAIIPARSGSKSVKDKNIRLMNGKPLLAYSIEQALQSSKINRVIVSTDSVYYQEIAQKYGAEVPFIRPREISQDISLDLEVFQHALQWLYDNENYKADICVHLRPTHPIREPEMIDEMVSMLEEDPHLDSMRSICLAKQTPYKMWRFTDDGLIQVEPILHDIPEAYNAPRQALPQIYMQNACIDIVRGSTILEKNSMTGDCIGGYVMKYDFDIDTEDDFLRAEKIQLLSQAVKYCHPLKVCCDIDGILASKTQNNNYIEARPIVENIEIINRLHKKGHHIILFTARGYETGFDWNQFTEDQMKEWNVLFDELIFEKPNADLYIDDKLIELENLKYFL